MKVSIIIPVLNEAAIIEETLQRLTSLEGDTEIIVVDGGSADDTVTIALRYAKVLNGPKGRASQMNIGAKEAKGDVLLFLHADTVLPEGAIDAIEKSLADPSVIGGRFRVRLDQPGWRYRMVSSSINLRDRLLKGFTGDQAIFIRAPVFTALGGYREMALMEDLDLGRRMCRLGKVIRLPLYVTTSSRRWQQNGVFRTILLMWTLRLLYLLGCPPERLNRFYGDAR